jgi:hypothetical protein
MVPGTERSAVSPASAAPRGLSVNAVVHRSRRDIQVCQTNKDANIARASIDGCASSSGPNGTPG